MWVTWIDTCDWMQRLCQHQQFTFIAHVNRLLPQGYLTIGNQKLLQPMGPRNFLAMPIATIHGLAKPTSAQWEKKKNGIGNTKILISFSETQWVQIFQLTRLVYKTQSKMKQDVTFVPIWSNWYQSCLLLETFPRLTAECRVNAFLPMFVPSCGEQIWPNNELRPVAHEWLPMHLKNRRSLQKWPLHFTVSQGSLGQLQPGPPSNNVKGCN